jgi:heat-inducible transcriptional repressor
MLDDLDERKAAILRAVIAEYIDTAQPVGSSSVACAPGVAVSAATVRNEMAALEQEGFLFQPHPSAGRIPTDKGYRFFVDHLRSPSLRPLQRQQIREFFAKAHGELEEMLRATSSLLSRLTDQAAVVVGPTRETGAVRSLQLVELSPSLAVVVVVLSNGAVEKRALELGEDVSSQTLAVAGAHLSAQMVGRSLGAAGTPAPIGEPVTDRVVAAARSAIGDMGEGSNQVFVGGVARMATAFSAIESVRSVLSILEQQLEVVTLLHNVLAHGQSVAIGTEHGIELLAGCSVVAAPYELEGEERGTIGVLGPTRMNYPETLAAVAAVGRQLGRYLSEG